MHTSSQPGCKKFRQEFHEFHEIQWFHQDLKNSKKNEMLIPVDNQCESLVCCTNEKNENDNRSMHHAQMMRKGDTHP
jgi:hypothetical protein